MAKTSKFKPPSGYIEASKSDFRLKYEAEILITAARASSPLRSELVLNDAENHAREISDSTLRAQIMREIETVRRELGIAFR